MASRRIVLVLILATATAVGLCFIIRYLRDRYYALEYNVTVTCDVLPEDDEQLDQWLSNQPGVRRWMVGRQGQSVGIGFVMRQNIARSQPPTPDIEGQLSTFGYQGNVRVVKEPPHLYAP